MNCAALVLSFKLRLSAYKVKERRSMIAKRSLAALSPIITLPADKPEPVWLTGLATLTVDFLAISAAYWLAVSVHYLIAPGSLDFYVQLFPGICVFLVAFATQGLYPGFLLHPAEETRRVFSCISTVFLLIACTAYLRHSAEWYSRSMFLAVWVAGAPVVLIARHLSRHYLSRTSWWGMSAVVLGSGSSAQRVIRMLEKRTLGVRVKGVLTDTPPASWPEGFPPILGDINTAPQIAMRRFAQYAIVAMPNSRHSELRHTIQDCCRGFSHVLLMPDMPGICSLGVLAREIGGELGFELPQRLFHQSAAFLKRAVDLFISLLVLALLFPLFLLITLAVKLTSPGPIFYGHSRYGRDGDIFQALKFRTMVRDSDAMLEEYLRDHPEDREEWNRDRKLRHDPRITAIGHWLRRYSLDELPQLWNVIKGDMSLVGPRPIVAAEIPKYGLGYNLYTRVRPGITGLWQVSGRNNTTYEERVAFDEYYVRNWSIWLDSYILARTAKVVLTAHGAY